MNKKRVLPENVQKVLDKDLFVLGNTIRMFRKARAMNLGDLAEMIGLQATNRGGLSRVEQGKNNITLPLLYAIADALKLKVKITLIPMVPQDKSPKENMPPVEVGGNIGQEPPVA